MRSLIVFSSALALTFCGAFGAQAGERATAARQARPDAHAASFPETGAVFIDLMAADFFESNLRLAQSRRIEAETAQRYQSLDAAGRARFRAARKRQWREMSESERAALRGTKRPRFANLDETQKQTFRQIAAQELSGGARSAQKLARGDI